MRVIARAWRRLRTWVTPKRFERELDEELSFHLEMQTRWHQSQGLDREAAQALAAREFGGRTRFEEAVRDARGITWTLDLGRDARMALRSYRRSPGFTTVSLATFALGIGITTAAFSVIHAVLIRPLPFPEPERIVALTGSDSAGNEMESVSAPNFYDWRDQSTSFEAIALYSTARRGVAGAGDAMHVETATVSGDFFRVMRTRPALGRVLMPADVEATEPVAVVSHGFWVRALGSARPLPDEPLRIGGSSYRIVGVLPPAREFPAGADVIMPYSFGNPWRTASRNNINFHAIARLAPAVSRAQAAAEMHAIATRVHGANPEDLYAFDVRVTPLGEKLAGPARTYLLMLGGAVAVVLLVACVNLANANLARAAVREREMAVRTALGASRMRLVRQLLVENVSLALVGGAAGIALAWMLVRTVARTRAIDLPRVAEMGVNATALTFALVLSVGVGVLVGLAPALRAGRSALYSAIASGSRSTSTRSRALSRDVLMGLELALAIVLLAAAGLLIRSFRVVLGRDVGFDPANAIAAELALPSTKYAGSRAVAYYDNLFPALRAIPGVSAVGATSYLPLGTGSTGFIEIEGQGDRGDGAGYRVITDDYFAAMGIPLLAGRLFDPRDDSGTTRVTLVNRRMADRFWPGQNPIGKRLKAKSMEWKNTPWLTVIGVVGDVRHWGLESDPPVEHYVLYRQRPEFAAGMAVVVRGATDASALLRATRDRVRGIDRDVAVEVGTLAARVDQSLAERRFIMTVLVAFGGLALVLAAIGVYGVLSFTVAQRTREIAVRLALGAERRRVLSMVVAHVLRVAAVACVSGLLAARALTRLMASLLFGVSPVDPRSYVAATTLLIGVALLAAYVPARRAASVDPMLTLRSD
jgi:putative ABC transport system permease protein